MGAPNRSGGRKVYKVNEPVDALDLTQIRKEAERSVDNQAPAPDPDPSWHETARLFYLAALESGQRALWEPSDVMFLYLLAEDLSRQLEPQFVGFRFVGSGSEQEPVFEQIPLPGSKLNAYTRAANELMLTASARQKAGIAVERKAAPKDDNADLVAQARYDRLQLVQGS